MIKPIEGMKYEPYGEDYMAGAWISFLSFALTVPEYVTDFKKETGVDIQNVLNARGINKMIDEAAGRTKDAIIKWADFITLNYWGIEEA